MIIQIGATDNLIDCFEARTPEEQVQGLRGAHGLPLSPEKLPTGLLFFYEEEDDRSFYMPQDMFFPIDMVFIGENGVVNEVFSDCQPGDIYPVNHRLESFKARAKWVLEVPAGVARELGIAPKVQIHFDDEDEEGGLV